MSVGKRKEEYGGGSQNKLVAVNPRDEVIGDNFEIVVESCFSYDGPVHRVDNINRFSDIAEFYRSEELLLRDLEEDADDTNTDPGWYDRAFMFDDEGLDSSDVDYILEDTDTIALVGGPLEDIGTVVNSLGEDQNYEVNPHLVFDYGAFNEQQGYVVEELSSIQNIMENSPETMDERLTRSGLEDVALDF